MVGTWWKDYSESYDVERQNSWKISPADDDNNDDFYKDHDDYGYDGFNDHDDNKRVNRNICP